MNSSPQDRFRVRATSCGLRHGLDWNKLNQLDLELIPIAIQHDFTEWADSQGLAALYIHGSTARGGARVDSDLDIAVLMKDQEPLSLLKETNLTAQLEKKLRPLLNSSREFDIRFLRGAPPAFQFQVIKARNILWEGDPESRVRFERELLREYLDFRHYEDRYQEALKQRLKEGSFGRRPPIRR